MSLEVLSSRESASLCRAAAVLVLERFRWLAQRADPGDLPLNRLFADLGGDVERNLVEITHLEGSGHVSELPELQMGRRVVIGFLPSLSKTAGEGRLNREAGFHLVECILEDLARFYSVMVRQTSDAAARELLLKSTQAVKERLDFLHRVVLQ